VKITLKQLQVFVSTAQTQSLSLAAERCFISQAAASMSLSQLESALDMKLFDRTSRQLKLNDNGFSLVVKASQVLDIAAEIESYSDDATEISGKLIIGASTTIANCLLPKYIAKFRTLYPNVDIELVSGNTQDVINLIDILNCDIGFIEGICDKDNILTTVWRNDQLRIVCNSNHELTNNSEISINDAMKYEWAVRESGSGTADILMSSLTPKYVNKLKVAIVLNSSEAIKQYIMNSQSLACLSDTMLTTNNEYTTIEIKGLDIKRSFYRLMHKTKYHSKLTRLFSEFIYDTSI
jgi:DNA-binding transcriptional LysR family regulator